jgi:hypothetical protein
MNESLRNSCSVRVGRLMEIDVAAGYRTVEDVDTMMGWIAGEMARVPPSARVVIAADWRGCTLFTPAVADRAHDMLTRTNPRLERSAILHRTDSATSVLQVMRLVREASFESRKVFTDPWQMEQWLGEVLGPPERASLSKLLHKR